MPNEITETWLEYRKLVIDKLESLDESVDELRDMINLLEKDLISNDSDMKNLINDEINKLRTKFDTIITTNKDDIADKVHKLDLQVNELKTKVVIIGTGISMLIGFGKNLIEHFFSK